MIDNFIKSNNINQMYISKGIYDNKFNILRDIDISKNEYEDLYKSTLFWGMYSYTDLNKLKNHKGDKYIYWGGKDSDVKKLEKIKNCLNDVKLHICNKEFVFKNLKNKFENVIFLDEKELINIDSVCTLGTYSCLVEIELFLLSLNLYSDKMNVYLLTDSKTKEYLLSKVNKYENLSIKIFNNLDKYDGISSNYQADPIKKKIWIDFMLEKGTIIDIALEVNSNTLFLDSDQVILNKLPKMKKSDICLSYHDIDIEESKKYGKYNGGCIFVNNNNFSKWWCEYTYKLKDKVFMEQGTLDYASKFFKVEIMDNNINFGYWRYTVNKDDIVEYRKFKFGNNDYDILYDNKILVSVHTHFFVIPKYSYQLNHIIKYNKLILSKLRLCKCEKKKKILNFIDYNQKKILNQGKEEIIDINYLNYLYNINFNEDLYKTKNNVKEENILEHFNKNLLKFNYMKKCLLITCDNGLTNRIFSIVNGLYLSKLFNKKLYIYWDNNHTCNCEYYDIFEYNKKINLINKDEYNNIIKYNDYNWFSTRENNESNLDLKNYILIKESIKLSDLNIIKDDKLVILTSYFFFTNFIKNYDIYNNFKSLIFRKHILDKFIKIKNKLKLDKDIYGIHIRESDSLYVLNNSGIKNLIINDIKELLKQNNDIKFFIASDSNNIKLEFSNLFRNNIIYYKSESFEMINNLQWGTKFELNNIKRGINSIIDGIIDFLLLNSTKFIYPSGYSTFSLLLIKLQEWDYILNKKNPLKIKWMIDCSKIKKSLDYKLNK